MTALPHRKMKPISLIFWRRHYNHKKVYSIYYGLKFKQINFLEATVVDVAKKAQATKSTGQNLNVEVHNFCLYCTCSTMNYMS